MSEAVLAQGQLPSYAPNAKRTDPEQVIYQKITRGMWDRLCQYTAEGVKVGKALKSCEIRMTVFRSIMRDDIAAREQMTLARADWDNRNWPEDLIQTICVRIAMGEKLVAVSNDEVFAIEAFHALRLRDDYVNEMYMKGKRIAAEGMVDELLEISDDTSKDMGMDKDGGDKPNTAAVQRARLRTENRKWLAGKLLKDVYGEHTQIEAKVDLVVDHASRLEEARVRKEAGSRAARAAVEADSGST
jgi:hypothetical protein